MNNRMIAETIKSMRLNQSVCALILCSCAVSTTFGDEPSLITLENNAFESFLASLPTGVNAERFSSSVDQFHSRKGPLVLSVLANRIPELNQIDFDQPNVVVPDWFKQFQEEQPKLASSIALAVAEQFYLREKYLGALNWLKGTEDFDVYSPSLRIYLIATSNYLLVDYDKALKTIDGIEADDEELLQVLGQSRQQTLIQLSRILKADQKEVNQISQRMFDIERRLAIGQTELPTIYQQQRVIDELDKLIEKLEQQQQQQQQQTSASGGSPSGTPAEDSVPAEGKGPGDVNRKRFATGDPWGQLSPAERERLSQSIDRDFPSHYRNLIENYYRRLAEGEEKYQESPGGSP